MKNKVIALQLFQNIVERYVNALDRETKINRNTAGTNQTLNALSAEKDDSLPLVGPDLHPFSSRKSPGETWGFSLFQEECCRGKVC
ncbi:MAG: hypothetical protein WCG29_14410 [Desulfomonile sp.]|nr:hypothetical protein [Deltaproteobacteria bacterium]